MPDILIYECLYSANQAPKLDGARPLSIANHNPERRELQAYVDVYKGQLFSKHGTQVFFHPSLTSSAMSLCTTLCNLSLTSIQPPAISIHSRKLLIGLTTFGNRVKMLTLAFCMPLRSCLLLLALISTWRQRQDMALKL